MFEVRLAMPRRRVQVLGHASRDGGRKCCGVFAESVRVVLQPEARRDEWVDLEDEVVAAAGEPKEVATQT